MNAIARARVQQVAENIAPRILESAFCTPVKQVSRDAALEEGAVTAPMPGIIVALKVNVRDSVKAGDVICILETMKMENEITIQRPGVVTQIKVSKGAGVKEGELIAIVKW